MTALLAARTSILVGSLGLGLLARPTVSYGELPQPAAAQPIQHTGPVPWEITWQWLEGGVCRVDEVFSRPGNLLCRTEACIPSTTFPGNTTSIASCIQLVTNDEFQAAVNAGITPAGISTILDGGDSVRLIEMLDRMASPPKQQPQQAPPPDDDCAPPESFLDYDTQTAWEEPPPETCTEADMATTTVEREQCGALWLYDCTVAVCTHGYETDPWDEVAWTMSRVRSCEPVDVAGSIAD